MIDLGLLQAQQQDRIEDFDPATRREIDQPCGRIDRERLGDALSEVFEDLEGRHGVAVGSYNQKMIFNLICDPRLLPDLDLMTDEVEQVFAELLAAAREKSASAA